jgi:hypothetical protein
MKKSIAFLLLALQAAPAFADATYLPKWHVRDGEACYAFADAKTLLLLDQRLVLCDTAEKTVKELGIAIDDLKLAFQKKSEALTVATDGAEQLRTALSTCIDEKAKAEVKASSGPSLGWFVALGLSLVLAGVAVDRYVLR